MVGLALRKVIKDYGPVRVVHGIDLDVGDGEFVVFVGPSGCGKSTLLRMIAGLETITSGDLTIGERRMNDTPASERGLAMVFQSYALYPHMSVYQNLAFGLENIRMPRADIERRVMVAAQMLQIDKLLQRKPRQLSGGQRQRVAIGRAITREPDVFLFDEPLSNLDAELRVQMRVELASLHKRLGNTMIYVTHDQVEAMTMADKIVVLRAGRVEQVGSPLDLYNAPANRFVAGFIGSARMNFVKGALASANGVDLGVTSPGLGNLDCVVAPHGLRAGDAVMLGIRPEHIEVGTGDSRLKVSIVEQLGGESHIHGTLASGEHMAVRCNGQVKVKSGEEIAVHVPAHLVHVFDTREGEQALAVRAA